MPYKINKNLKDTRKKGNLTNYHPEGDLDIIQLPFIHKVMTEN